MLPTKETALLLLIEAYQKNPGPWKDHSLVVAECAYKIAAECPDMNKDKAYIVGLLHDIGRRFGIKHLAHVIEGYDYLLNLGYDEAARICITHSFAIKDINTIIGKQDVSDVDRERICELLKSYQYDEYDLLIQVCDSVAMADGPVEMEKRISDVKKRYGNYPEIKWNRHLELKKYFEDKMGKSLNEVLKFI